MNTALSPTTRPTRTPQPATWAGLLAALIGTRRVADARAEADPLGQACDVAALCTRTLEALAAARPEDEVPTLPTAGRLTSHDRGHADGVDLESDLAALVGDTLALAVAVLDNHDEPLSCAEVMAISRTVTALCTARAALAGLVR